jgi:hypothetical protein
VAIIEPWADEFRIEPGVACRVVALHPRADPTFEVELHQGVLIVYVNESGSTFEFWRGETREYWTPVAIP